jgi:DNA-directed RNA polymerase specialized sigma24 family protein
MESPARPLLERLRQPDQAGAWERFARLCTPLLVYWSRLPGYCLSADEADELVQGVLGELGRELPGFTAGAGETFRDWFRGVFDRKWLERWQRTTVAMPAGEALATRPFPPGTDSGGDEEERRLLLRRALEVVRPDCEPAEWEACWGAVAQERPEAEVAAGLGVGENAVCVAVVRVLRHLRQEMAGLLD